MLLCNSVGYVNKVMLRRARLVLGLVTTFGPGSTIPVLIQAHSAWPSSMGRCSEYQRWFLATAGEETASSA